MANSSLDRAKKAKNDEFYTQFDDIQAELNHYKDQFQGKVVYCNCDDPAESAFSDFFKLNFDYFGLKKLICTRYVESTLFTQAWLDPTHRVGYKLEITSKNQCKKTNLNSGGDFRSSECVQLLKEADIVCTNPPFSLFREYTEQLFKYNKKFLIVGPMNAITYKEFFPHILHNEVWCGYNHPKKFISPKGEIQQLGNVQWWTNLDTIKRHEDMILYETYTPEKFPRYDNYDAIEVSKVKSIPKDYFDIMGVPITFLDSYNPDQFKIVGITLGNTVDYKMTTVYKNAIQHNKNGSSQSGNKVNTRAAILLESPPPDKVYYTADNANGYLLSIYPRLLIKRKDVK